MSNNIQPKSAFPYQNPVVGRTPQSEVWLSKVNWDNKYIHCRDFGSTGALHSYVTANGFRLPNFAYVSIGKNYTIDVPYNEFVANKYNYIAFRNLPFDNTWNYAFIVECSMIGDNACSVKFEMDDFQNEFYNLTLKPCFVEYEHIAKSDDSIGANCVPEGDETGDYVYYNTVNNSFGSNKLVMYIAGSESGISGDLVNSVFTGIDMVRFDAVTSANIGTINDFLGYFRANQDSLLAMYMYPSICDPGSTPTQAVVNASNIFGGYTPQNNKCYTYPYAFVTADDYRGNRNIYKFELSNTPTSLAFDTRGYLATAPAVYTRAMNYKGVALDDTTGITTTNFPIVGWSNDAFQAYLAQNRSTLALNTLTSATQIGGGLALASSGNIAGLGLASSGVGSVINSMAKISDASTMPNSGKGGVLSDNVAWANGQNMVSFYATGVRQEMIERIDNRMSVFGYKTNRIKVPNIRNRSSWNYVKTSDCGFTGDTDRDTLQRLRAIFNNGVTLWHTDDIGNYSLANN